MKAITPITNFFCLALIVFALSDQVEAKPAYRKQVVGHFSSYVSRSVMTCALRRLTDAQVKTAGDAIDPFDEKPWNRFGTARLVGGRIYERWLEDETTSPPDRDQCDLPHAFDAQYLQPEDRS